MNSNDFFLFDKENSYVKCSWFPNLSNNTNIADSLHYGYYSVTITDKNNCTKPIDFIKVDSIFVTFLSDNILNSSVKVYPNPVTNFLNIEINNPSMNEIKIMLYSVLGQLLENRIIKQPEEKTIQNIDLNRYPAQVYLLKINIVSEWLHYRIALVK